MKVCPSCHGSGSKRQIVYQTIMCMQCGGSGRDMHSEFRALPCHICNGKGMQKVQKSIVVSCTTCGGRGYIGNGYPPRQPNNPRKNPQIGPIPPNYRR